jgi:hypothetical protein
MYTMTIARYIDERDDEHCGMVNGELHNCPGECPATELAPTAVVALELLGARVRLETMADFRSNAFRPRRADTSA